MRARMLTNHLNQRRYWRSRWTTLAGRHHRYALSQLVERMFYSSHSAQQGILCCTPSGRGPVFLDDYA